MAENFPNLKDIDIKIQEEQRTPNRPMPRHIIIKMAKLKREDSKASKKKTKN